MAEPKIAAPFPAPPPFYKHFTKANINRLRLLRREAGIPQSNPDPFSPTSATTDPSLDIDLLSLPVELRYLVPPAPPSDGKYTSFGVAIDQHAAEPTLSSADIAQLYPSSATAVVRLNPQPHLLALTRSLLTTFLSLTGVLSQAPEQYETAVQDLQTLMYNIHDLINQYRPHQARESLILMMEERVARVRAEIRSVDEAKAKVQKLLDGLRDGGVQQGMRDADAEAEKQAAIGDGADAQQRKARQRAAWRGLEAEIEIG